MRTFVMVLITLLSVTLLLFDFDLSPGGHGGAIIGLAMLLFCFLYEVLERISANKVKRVSKRDGSKHKTK